MILLACLLIGIVAGLRAMTAPAAVSLGAYLGWLPVGGSWAEFMGYRFAPWIFGLLALAEFVTDQLPSTPSRKVPVQFGTRIASGAFCGAVIGTAGGVLIAGLAAGAIGAVIGTYGGAAARARLAAAFDRDRPAAIIEDAAAIVLGLAAVAVAA